MPTQEHTLLKPSHAQVQYLNILFEELNYTWDSRIAYLQHRFSDKKILHYEDLTNYQASNAIQHLSGIRRSMRR